MPTPDGAIGSRDLCTGAAVERVIADGGVTSLKISATLQSDNYSPGSAGWQINRATGSAEFQDAVIRGTLNANDITTGYIDAAVIEVRNLDANEIKSGSISADRIATTALNASNISSGSLSADYISGGTISGDIIDGGTISGYDVSITNLNASNIVAGTIGASRISVSSLSAISGDSGDIDITGDLVVNGGSFKTGTSGQRIEMTDSDPDRIWFPTGQETTAAYITAWASGGTAALRLYGPNADAGVFLQEGGAAQLYGNDYAEVSDGVRTIRIDSPGLYDSAAQTGMFLIKLNAVGSASAPTYSFSGNTDTGIFRSGSDQVGFAAGGELVMYMTTDYLTNSDASNRPAIRFDNSCSVSAPAYSFYGDTDTGLYQVAGNYVAMSAGGYIMQQWGWSGSNKNIYLYGLPSTATNYVRWNGSTGELGYSSSTLRIKKNIRPLDVGLTDRLRPSWFEYRTNDEIDEMPESDHEHQSSQFRVGDGDVGTVHAGLIAEWTADVREEFGIYNDDDPIPVNYEVEAVLAAVVADLQDARRRVAILEGA